MTDTPKHGSTDSYHELAGSMEYAIALLQERLGATILSIEDVNVTPPNDTPNNS